MIEKALKINAYRKNMLKDSVGQNKTAKLWFKTEDFMNSDVFMVTQNFIKEFEPKFEQICEFKTNLMALQL